MVRIVASPAQPGLKLPSSGRCSAIAAFTVDAAITLCIEGPAFDQVTTLSKFLCMGMPLSDVIAASTVNAAMALQRPELGSFKPGCAGDATILTIKDGQFDYVDVVGEHLIGDKRLLSEGVVLNGRWWHPNDASKFKKLEKAA